MNRTIQVVSPEFTCGVVLVWKYPYWIVGETGPDLRCLIGLEDKDARRYCVNKGWSIVNVS